MILYLPTPEYRGTCAILRAMGDTDPDIIAPMIHSAIAEIRSALNTGCTTSLQKLSRAASTAYGYRATEQVLNAATASLLKTIQETKPKEFSHAASVLQNLLHEVLQGMGSNASRASKMVDEQKKPTPTPRSQHR